MTAPADAERAVRDRTEDVVLIIDKDFEHNMSRARPAPVKLVSDVTRDSARPKVARVRSLIAGYSQMIGGLRLITRGVAPLVATAIRIEEIEVSSSQQRLATQLSILPLLLVLAALTGGMQIAIDSTAGERERGSLEPLLLNPVSTSALAIGKWLAASLFGFGAVIFSMLLTINVMRRVPWHDLGVRFTVSDGDLHEPPGAGAAGRALPERAAPLRVDVCPIFQGGPRLPDDLDARPDAAGHRLDGLSTVQPAMVGPGADSGSVRAGRGRPRR